MASDVVRVRLRETRVLRVQVGTPSELRVEIESTVRRPRCPACGFGCARVHDTRRRDIRDVGVSGRRTTLVRRRRRFRCGGCEHRLVEGHPGFDGRLRRRLARRLVADAEVNEPGYVKMRTRSSRFTVPVQIDIFDAPTAGSDA